jgi:hypothetical protein
LLPILLFATLAVNLLTATIRSLDFCVVRFVMKLNRSNNKDIAAGCMDCFGLQLPSALTVVRWHKFITLFNANFNDNIICKIAACSRQ